MIKAIILFATLVALSQAQTIVIEDMSPYCSLVRDGTKLRNPSNQNAYFECYDGVAKEQKCNEDYIFNKDEQVCVIAGDSACAGETETWVRGTNCAFIYCIDGKAKGSGFCPKGQYFNGTACDFGDCPYGQGSEEQMEISSMCDIMPIGMFFGDATNCNNWYRCTSNGLGDGNCPDNQLFDVSRSQCLYGSEDNICTRIGGDAFFPGDDIQNGGGGNNGFTCNAEGYFADDNVCSRYYYCQKTGEDAESKPIYSQATRSCREGEYVTAADSNSVTCQPRLMATPLKPGCDRCEASNLNFVTVMGTKCTTYVRCANNRAVAKSETECPQTDGPSFFNEISVACFVGDVNNYSLQNVLCT